MKGSCGSAAASTSRTTRARASGGRCRRAASTRARIPRAAALRELAEETAVTSAAIIAESPEWYNYDLPDHLIGKSWKGKYRGQTQKWFALRFLGDDSEINLAPPGHKQEFDQWRWARMDEILDIIVPFKRPVYERVIADFRHLGA